MAIRVKQAAHVVAMWRGGGGAVVTGGDNAVGVIHEHCPNSRPPAASRPAGNCLRNLGHHFIDRDSLDVGHC